MACQPTLLLTRIINILLDNKSFIVSMDIFKLKGWFLVLTVLTSAKCKFRSYIQIHSKYFLILPKAWKDSVPLLNIKNIHFYLISQVTHSISLSNSMPPLYPMSLMVVELAAAWVIHPVSTLQATTTIAKKQTLFFILKNSAPFTIFLCSVQLWYNYNPRQLAMLYKSKFFWDTFVNILNPINL